ncbi:MAG: NHLP bacteriocin system secretion protein [Gemmatimonadota bacterium]|nr:NHLP bacteriocin system secretion protein [Gemmatimonadota bacterium]
MTRPSIFRQAALDRLSSPEQLDRLMQVTLPTGWIALVGVWLAVGVTILWSIFGSIPTTVSGSGIIMSSGGIREVEVLGSGVVERLAVVEGDLVEVGDLIAVIGQPQISQQVGQARERLSLLEEERVTRQRFTTANTELESGTLDREALDQERQIVVAQERISWLEGRVEAEREARALGLITEGTVQNTVQLLEASRGELNGLHLQLQNNDLRRLLLENRSVETMDQMDERIREAERTLQSLTLELERTSIVLSPYRGYVREFRTDVGQLTTAGQAIVSLEMVDAPLHAVIFIPTEGKRIQSGMEAHVSPATVRREEYGFMIGEVSFVSAQPATPAGMRRTLNNDILVQELSAFGAPFVVEVSLERDEATVSGFRWSSRRGPPVSVESGMSVSVDVVVARRRPISLVLPIFRNALGLSV